MVRPRSAVLAFLIAAAMPDEVRGRRALVLCTEGATDPDAYRRIVGHDAPSGDG